MIRMYSVEFFFIRSMNAANSDVGVIEDDHYTEKRNVYNEGKIRYEGGLRTLICI